MVELKLLTPAEKVFRNKDAQEVVIGVDRCLAGATVRSRVIVQQACRKECKGQCEQNESKQEDVVCKFGTFKIGIPCGTVAFCVDSKFSLAKCHSAPKTSCHGCGHLGQCGPCSAKSKQFDEQGSLLAVDPCCFHK